MSGRGEATSGRSRRRWVLAAVAGVVVVLVAAGGAVLWTMGPRAQRQDAQQQIRTAVDGFGAAVDDGDMVRAVTFLCRAEADQVRGSEGFDPSTEGSRGSTRSESTPVDITELDVPGGTAKARVRALGQDVRLVREDGTWKLCNPR